MAERLTAAATPAGRGPAAAGTAGRLADPELDRLEAAQLRDDGRRLVVVHPNSTATRKWGRTSWSSTRNVWAEAAEAERAGDRAQAAALRRAGARAGRPDLHCG